MNTQYPFDTLIVGGRVAGTSLAIHLARRGQKVAVLDRASFPSDTLSTHVIYPNTLARLDALGVLARIMDHRPPPLYTVWHHDGRTLMAPHTPVAGRDWAICVRRITLDAILIDQARSEGVTVFENTQVTGLLGTGSDQDPVRGLVGQGSDGPLELRASLVVGADGANSSVARMVGAEKYDVMPTETMLYYAYWKDADVRNTQDFFFEPPWVMAHFPSDNGYHVVTMNGPVAERASIKDIDAFYMDRIASVPTLWSRLRRAQKVSRVKGTTRLEGFYRRSTGAGWALTGDASHFKHPASAQGIGDALHAAEVLAPMIMDDSYREAYPAWRARASRELYAFCKHLAETPSDEGMNTVFQTLIHDPEGARRLFDVWCRTSRPWTDVIPRVPGMERIMGTSIDEVLAPFEAGDLPARKIA